MKYSTYSFTTWIQWAIIWIVGIITFLAIVAWPENAYPFQSNESSGAEPTANAAQIVEISDDDILEAIETELRTDDAVTADTIDVEVRQGIATLSGTTFTLFAKRRSTRLVGSLKGVRAVVNNIRVVTERISDAKIKDTIELALEQDPVTEAAEITIEVQSGSVTISGEVQSYAEKVIVESVVADIRGVTEIKNEVAVRSTSERKDAEIRPEILRRFEYSAHLAEGLIDVAVEKGVVTLTGTVGSANEKDLAVLLCWVAGVRNVHSSELHVDSADHQERRRDKFVVLRNDLDLRKAVEDALTYDPRVNRETVVVRVKLGAVTLRGNVSSLAAKRAAQRDAENTLGVRRVVNQLKVRVAEWPGDLEVTKRAQAALDRDDYLNGLELQASSHFGKVYLAGAARSQFEKQRAEAVVENVVGVLDLSNRIVVDAPWEPKPDEDIQEDTERRLHWSPLLDSETIDVSVDDGIVLLTGKVDTWQDRRAAATYAMRVGARSVKNKLKVRSARTSFSGLDAKLVPGQIVYTLPDSLRNETFPQGLNHGMIDVDSLPAAPSVDVALRLTNKIDQPVSIRVGHDAGELELSLVGDGAEHVSLPRTFVADFRSGQRITIQPGKHLDIPIKSLQYGFRNESERWYWTEPGEYMLNASFTWPRGFNGMRTYSVDAPPIKLTVE